MENSVSANSNSEINSLPCNVEVNTEKTDEKLPPKDEIKVPLFFTKWLRHYKIIVILVVLLTGL